MNSAPRFRKNKASAVAVLLGFLLFSQAHPLIAKSTQLTKSTAVIKIEGQTMGTYYRVSYWLPEKSPYQLSKQLPKNKKTLLTEAVISQKVKKKLLEVNQVFSHYIPDSEISTINRLKVGEKFQMSAEFKQLLARSMKFTHLTGGYFDPSIGPLINLYGFGPSQENKIKTKQTGINPKTDTLSKKASELLKLAGYRAFRIDLNRGLISKTDQRAYLNFSAIAKGYGVDEVAKLLASLRVDNFLVDIGGELRSQGGKKGGQPWRIGLESPVQAGLLIKSPPQKIIALRGLSVATSGNYRNYKRLASGELVGHTFDPLEGRPKWSNVLSVSVVEKSCADADALATAMMAMKMDQVRVFVKKQKLSVYVVYHEGGVDTPPGKALRVFESTAFKKSQDSQQK